MVLHVLEDVREDVPSPLAGHNELIFYLPRNIIKVAYYLGLTLKLTFNQCMVPFNLSIVKDDSSWAKQFWYDIQGFSISSSHDLPYLFFSSVFIHHPIC